MMNMTKHFLSLIAVLAISLLAACAQLPSNCKGCPASIGMECCGACPCGDAAVSGEQASGKICDHKKAKKHHRRHYKAAAAAPSAVKDAKAAPTIPNQEQGKAPSMFDGVKKIIQDVQSKDVKKPE